MWFVLQLLFGLLSLVVSSYHTFLMSQRAFEASALGEASLTAFCYGVVGFHLLLAALSISYLYFAIKLQRERNAAKASR